MTNEQHTQCHTIIHTAAVAAAVGNLVPIPGLGVATDLTVMTGMAIALAAVFGRSIPKAVAEAAAIAAIKDVILKQPLNVIVKEASKFIPFLGQIVAPAISFGMVEAAGWSIVSQLEHGMI
jgi:uncharacterized protein (DUF697 family)